MEDVARAVPVGQRDLDDLAPVRRDDLAELADALGVGPVAVTDAAVCASSQTTSPPSRVPGSRISPRTGQPALAQSSPTARGSPRRSAFPIRPRTTPAARRGGVADVDGIEPVPVIGREEVDLGNEPAQKLDEPVVLVAGPAEIRLGRVAQRPPLAPDGFPIARGLSDVLEKEASRGFGQTAGHAGILAFPEKHAGKCGDIPPADKQQKKCACGEFELFLWIFRSKYCKILRNTD